MSYRSQPTPPARQRSSSAVRSTGSSYGSRPRSVGYYGNTNPYSSPYSNTPSNSYSSSLSNYNNFSSNYKSPYFQNSYRGSATTPHGGYASLTIPAKALANVNVLTPSYSKNYDNSRDYIKSGGHTSRRDLSTPRTGSFRDRERSLSRSRASLSSGLGSKSISLTSLNSEGYASGADRSSRSRLESANDLRNENGEIDYKKLYEEAIVENDRLKDKLKRSNEDLRETKHTLEKLSLVTSKNSLSELEKREKRAMERKLSEMEEELKQLQKLKSENERLKADNKSLTRVINKLTEAAKK